MSEVSKSKGFGSLNDSINTLKEKDDIKEPKGRLISWSPWPPANFKTRYPAFPLVTTILVLIILRWLSTLK